MSITKEQQQALDDALVLQEQRLRIGNCNYRLSTIFKPKEPTFQVALDVLSLTLDMLQICPNLPGQKFVDPPFEEEILAFMRELGYPGNIKLFKTKAQSIHFGTLPVVNTIPNPKGEIKAITTRSGVTYEGPSNPTNPSLKKVVERETEDTTDKEQTNFQGSTAQIPPPVIPISILEPDVPTNFA
ncbi:hypothetical protein Tco_0409688 [Tanacetum coccineum]